MSRLSSVHDHNNNDNDEDDVVVGDEVIYEVSVFVSRKIVTFSLPHFVSSFPLVLYIKGHSRPHASHENGHYLKKAS